MTIALVTNTAKGNASNGAITTDAVDTSGASLLVVAANGYNCTLSGHLTDSKGNTWSELTLRGSSESVVRLYYAAGSPTVGSGHTFSLASGHNGLSGFHTLAMAAFSGAHATPYEAESGAAGTGEPLRPGSLTPAESGCLLVTGLTWYPSGTVSVDGGFTITNQIDYVVAGAIGGALAYLVQTSAAAANPGWSHSGSFTSAAVACAVFKPAAGGGSFQSAWARGSNVVLQPGLTA